MQWRRQVGLVTRCPLPFKPALTVVYACTGDENDPAGHQHSAPADDSSASTPAKSRQDLTNSSMQGLHMGYVLLASVLIGLALGYGFDQWLGTLPWGMVGGSLFFIIAGLYQVVKGAQR